MEASEKKEKEKFDSPKYRVSFETAADSPEELDRRIQKGMHRHLKRKMKRGGRKLSRK